MPNGKAWGLCVPSQKGVSRYSVLDFLVSPKLSERHGCFGIPIGASKRQRRPPNLTHTHERERVRKASYSRFTLDKMKGFTESGDFILSNSRELITERAILLDGPSYSMKHTRCLSLMGK